MRKYYFISGVIGSYVSLVATVIYAIALVPIALAHLPTEEFGLWMVLVQVSTYLTLLELGMFPAAARILIDHKDDRCSSGAYSAAILSAAAIFALQSFLVLLVGYFLSGMVGAALSVPPHLEAQASSLFMWFVVAAALGTFGRVWSLPCFTRTTEWISWH
jgi:O-antigen/teichoic acid export membrane protein